jgi:hypothetical protein
VQFLPVILGSRSFFRSYPMAPTIAAWRSLLQVALAVVAGVYTGETGLSVCSCCRSYCGSGTPVLSAVLVGLLFLWWRWICTPVPATPAVCSAASSLLALLALVVVEAGTSCSLASLPWLVLGRDASVCSGRWESMGVILRLSPHLRAVGSIE